MKNILIYLSFFASGLVLFRCDKPAPTELVNDAADDIEVDIITKDLNDNYATTGSDTSGVTQDLTGIKNLISVSGIKLTKEHKTTSISLAQAMFFDKNKPPARYSNGNILAYQTITPGTIKFNGIQARIVPYEIKYWDMGQPKVAQLGEKFVLVNILFGFPDPFYYSYSSSVSFDYIPDMGQGNNVSFNIPTPPEIIGKITLSGNRRDKDLEAILEWNGEGFRRISIIVGVKKKEHEFSIPVYRIKTGDDGWLKIPKRFFSGLPLNELDRIVITFVRSIESFHGQGNNELFVSSQSIHSIHIDIP